MDLTDLLADVRQRIDDTVDAPYLYTDAQLTAWLNDAVEEVCFRTRCLQDSDTAVCSIAITEGDRLFAIDPCIFVVRQARLDGIATLPELKNARWMDAEFPGWDDTALAPSGQPKYIVFDTDQHRIAVYPIPDDDYTLTLRVWRGPTETERLESGSDEPVVAPRFHRHLPLWVAFEAFNQKDSELYDPARADRCYSQFEGFVGKRPTAHDLRIMATSRQRGTKAHFY